MAETVVASPQVTGSKQVQRLPNGRFPKGYHGPGRRKGSRPIEGLLNDALKRARATRTRLLEPCRCVPLALIVSDPKAAWAVSCLDIDEHFARQSFRDNTVLVAFQKKRIPDLQHQTGTPAPTQINVLYGHRATVQVRQPIPAGNGHDA